MDKQAKIAEIEEYLHDLVILLRSSNDQDEVDLLEAEIRQANAELRELEAK